MFVFQKLDKSINFVLVNAYNHAYYILYSIDHSKVN
jgi:hypothetical protein